MANLENVPTPWGKSQGGQELAKGIKQYHTAGHGGVKVLKKRNEQIPMGFRTVNGWYEEDVAMCIVMYFHFESIKKHMTAEGMPGYSNWKADDYFAKFSKEYFKGQLEKYYIPESIHHFGTLYPKERLDSYDRDRIKNRIDAIKRKEMTPPPKKGDIIIFDKGITSNGWEEKYTKFEYYGKNVFMCCAQDELCRIKSWREYDYRIELE